MILLLLACMPGDSTVDVYAASSLTDAFNMIEGQFERAHPGIDVRMSHAGSQVLRTQLEHGAQADLFVSADPKHIQQLQAQGIVREAHHLAHNELSVLIPKGSPVGSFAMLPMVDRIVLASPESPLGTYTDAMLKRTPLRASIESKVVSRESNARLVRAKVTMGEADAAILYASDTQHVHGMTRVAVPDSLQVKAEYQLGLLNRSRATETFAAYLLAGPGRELLEMHGFKP